MNTSDFYSSLNDTKLNKELIKCGLNTNGNRKEKEKRLLIAYDNNTEFIIQIIDITVTITL